MENRCIPDQSEDIHSSEMEALAVLKIVSLARSAFADKDMILVSCAEDLGVLEIRAALPGVPAVGAGEAAVGMAVARGAHVGVPGIIDETSRAYRRVSWWPTYAPKACTARLTCKPRRTAKVACVRGLQVKEMGADVIALGCTGLATIDIAPEFEAAKKRTRVR